MGDCKGTLQQKRTYMSKTTEKYDMEMTEKPAAEGTVVASPSAAGEPATIGESVGEQAPYPVGKFTGFLCRKPILAMVSIFLFTIVIVGIGAVAGGGGFGWVGTGGYLVVVHSRQLSWRPFKMVCSAASIVPFVQTG